MNLPTALDVLDFWWRAGPDKWFETDPALDADIAARFGALHAEAAAGRLASWEATADGALALLILLDQFSRNLYRNTPRAFAQDEAARKVAERALARGFDRAFPVPHKGFFYLPFMHAEDPALQKRCVALYEAAGDSNGESFARMHRDAIARFGRFPTRNKALGRETTEEEQTYLDNGGLF